MFLRVARPADAMAVARMHVRSWQATYRGLLFDDYLDALQPEEWAQRYTFTDPEATKSMTVLAVEGSEICGLATIGPAGDGDQQAVGELLALYVDPDRRGLASAVHLSRRLELVLLGRGLPRRVCGCSPEMSGPSASTGSTVGPPTGADAQPRSLATASRTFAIAVRCRERSIRRNYDIEPSRNVPVRMLLDAIALVRVCVGVDVVAMAVFVSVRRVVVDRGLDPGLRAEPTRLRRAVAARRPGRDRRSQNG